MDIKENVLFIQAASCCLHVTLNYFPFAGSKFSVFLEAVLIVDGIFLVTLDGGTFLGNASPTIVLHCISVNLDWYKIG